MAIAAHGRRRLAAVVEARAVSPPPAYTQMLPVYALTAYGLPLVAASLHPYGTLEALARARAAQVEVSPDGRLVDGEWLRADMRALQPELVPLLSALLVAVVEQGMLLNEVRRLRKAGTPAAG